MNLFGRKKTAASSGPDPAQTILKLRSTTETLEKRQVFLDKKIEQQTLECKKCMAKKDKRGALYALKRKKMYEAEIEKINGARLTLEQQMIAIEASVTNTETVEAMRSGAAAMAAARKKIGAEDVEDIMSTIQDEMEEANEIAAAISAPANDVLNDEDLLNELNELEELELEAQLLDAPQIPSRPMPELYDLPVPPTKLPASRVAETEDADLRALRELEAQMAM
ncbi:Snf7-domain-containing protein [Pelagophyceae sp. CCMP2097]|nr:Snf7-domain-containing protein [Pelagophyceae sp. CCMP2097]